MKILPSTPGLLQLSQINWMPWRSQLVFWPFILLLLILPKADDSAKLICRRNAGNCLVASSSLAIGTSRMVKIDSIEKVEVVPFESNAQVKLVTAKDKIIVGLFADVENRHLVANKLSKFLLDKDIPIYELNEKTDSMAQFSSSMLFVMFCFALWRIKKTEVSFMRSMGQCRLQIYHIWNGWEILISKKDRCKLSEIKDVQIRAGRICLTLDNSLELFLSDDPAPNQDRLEKTVAEIQAFLAHDSPANKSS
jgi:hypothetical protein